MPVTRRRVPGRRDRRSAFRATAMVAVVLALAGALAGCRTSGLVFGGYQLRVVSPGQNSTVTLPMTITWSAGDLYQPGDTYAVFVDGTPVGVGRSITDLIPQSCLVVPDCSRTPYYEQANVWLTTKPSLVLTSIQQVNGQNSNREFHVLTIILLDKAQVRVSEEYASLDFLYVRPSW